MTAAQLLTVAQAAGLALEAQGDRLIVDAPAGALTPALRDELASHKPELLVVLCRLDAMHRHGVDLSPGKLDPARPPVAMACWPGRGGPGWCFSCGDPLGHPGAYGRCTACDIAADVFYASLPDRLLANDPASRPGARTP